MNTYLDTIDSEIPGLLRGLYLVGSVALGDFRPRTSDIDFVAVTDRALGLAEIAALERVHNHLRRRWPRPCFNGSYVTWDDLACDPARSGPGPYTHEGIFHRRSAGSWGDPVTWHTLAHHGIACRGPKPSEAKIWADRPVLAHWTLTNIDCYWRRLLDRASRLFTAWSWLAYSPYGAVWIVLGITRLDYTLATGDIVSKEGAGRYGLDAFPKRWCRILEESLRLRETNKAQPDVTSAVSGWRHFLPFTKEGRSLYRTPWARKREILAYGEMVIAECHRLHSERHA